MRDTEAVCAPQTLLVKCLYNLGVSTHISHLHVSMFTRLRIINKVSYTFLTGVVLMVRPFKSKQSFILCDNSLTRQL